MIELYMCVGSAFGLVAAFAVSMVASFTRCEDELLGAALWLSSSSTVLAFAAFGVGLARRL